MTVQKPTEKDGIVELLSENDKKVLLNSQVRTSIDSISNRIPLDMDTVRACVRKLFSLGLVEVENEASVSYVLTEKGKKYQKEGLPEYRIARLLEDKRGTTYKDLDSLGLDRDELNAAIGILKRENMIEINGNQISLTGSSSKLLHKNSSLNDIADKKEIDMGLMDEFKRRKIIEVLENTKEFVNITALGSDVIKSNKFSVRFVDKLTQEAIEDWKTLSFRRYDLNADIPVPLFGRKNIIKEFMSMVKEALTSMGFKEMKSNFTESTFWNFDVMLFKQDHPDRDIQDTFYVSGAKAKTDKSLIKKIKKVYETGFEENPYNLSLGYDSKFDPVQSEKVILRAHTTATTFRYIYNLISKDKDKPARYFSVSKVFRNETLDQTHLPEFYQIEGIVYDDNLSLRSLIGYFYEFYGKLGIKKIRIKPTYNPYTEPSIEVQGFNERLNRWIEIGNSGIFRPETLTSFGINKRIIAWGFALERALALRLNVEDIRQLYGPYTDLNFLRGVKTSLILN
ncbi:MAG: phenylalanine--tRNA ligase subunit alpha [Candidatus Parvarchaeota archaeon]|nr:phenylalanine--tRNA ligase subunit alpha [Candidatus Parvarchaeota archaeon]